MTTLYHFEPTTGEYLKENEARLDPIEGKPLVPANATKTAPPNAKDGFASVWNGKAWDHVIDQRGPYWLNDGSEHQISELGKMRPSGALLKKPAPTLEASKADAASTIQSIASAVVLAIGGNPSADEIASWPEKVTASKAAIAGHDFDAVTLASTMQDHGVDAIGAAQVILLRARLYRLAKAAAEIIANGAKQSVGAASDRDGITAALEGFKAALATRQQQFGQIALAAKSGDLAPLEAAEAEIIGS